VSRFVLGCRENGVSGHAGAASMRDPMAAARAAVRDARMSRTFGPVLA
jgi:hypothetical protein